MTLKHIVNLLTVLFTCIFLNSVYSMEKLSSEERNMRIANIKANLSELKNQYTTSPNMRLESIIRNMEIELGRLKTSLGSLQEEKQMRIDNIRENLNELKNQYTANPNAQLKSLIKGLEEKLSELKKQQ